MEESGGNEEHEICWKINIPQIIMFLHLIYNQTSCGWEFMKARIVVIFLVC